MLSCCWCEMGCNSVGLLFLLQQCSIWRPCVWVCMCFLCDSQQHGPGGWQQGYITGESCGI